MRRLVFSAILLAMAFIPMPALADGFSSIVDNGRVKFSLSYPAEVKIGSCFTLTFQTTILGNIDIVKLRLTVTYISEAGSQTVLSDTIISSTTSFSPGDTINKVYAVCVPSRVVRDPVVVASLFANYTRSPAAEPLTHNWLIAVARQRTYDEVARDLEDARATINSLRATIDSLRAEVTALRERVESLAREASRLEVMLGSSQEAYNKLKNEYDSLSNEFKSLNERYLKTLGDLQNLQARYEELRKENDALSGNYQRLLADYNSLSDDFKSLQASYGQLQIVYGELRNRHDAANTQIGTLQQQLDDARRSMDLLQLSYNSLSQENLLNRNIAYAQAAALIALSSVATTAYIARRRRGQPTPQSAALPPSPPQSPPASAATPPQDEKPQNLPTVGSGAGRVQKVLSGRRITIPREYAGLLGLQVGESISVEVRDGSLIVRPYKS